MKSKTDTPHSSRITPHGSNIRAGSQNLGSQNSDHSFISIDPIRENWLDTASTNKNTTYIKDAEIWIIMHR